MLCCCSAPRHCLCTFSFTCVCPLLFFPFLCIARGLFPAAFLLPLLLAVTALVFTLQIVCVCVFSEKRNGMQPPIEGSGLLGEERDSRLVMPSGGQGSLASCAASLGTGDANGDCCLNARKAWSVVRKLWLGVSAWASHGPLSAGPAVNDVVEGRRVCTPGETRGQLYTYTSVHKSKQKKKEQA